MTEEVEKDKSNKTYFQMLAIYYRLNDIKGQGEQNIFIRFMI